MSKIYDALQRAEQERALAAETSGKSQNAAISQAAALSEQPQVFPPPEATVPSTEGTSNPEHVVTELTGIQPSVWTPDWRRLPSLDTRGPLLEQFRILRSRVHELRSQNRLKSLLIGSGLPKEGKSFVTVNLALTLASSKGNRVLLIDGDMRRASIHKVLGAQSQSGLSEYLGGSATPYEILQRGISPEGQPPLPDAFASLTFIGAGGDTENAADLSGNRRFGELLRWAEPYFDWIIVDSSPVNLVADSVNLARACDGVLFIVRSGSTRLEFAKRALEELRASKLLGIVLNAVEDLPTSHAYYGYAHSEAGEDRKLFGR